MPRGGSSILRAMRNPEASNPCKPRELRLQKSKTVVLVRNFYIECLKWGDQ